MSVIALEHENGDACYCPECGWLSCELALGHQAYREPRPPHRSSTYKHWKREDHAFANRIRDAAVMRAGIDFRSHSFGG